MPTGRVAEWSRTHRDAFPVADTGGLQVCDFVGAPEIEHDAWQPSCDGPNLPREHEQCLCRTVMNLVKASPTLQPPFHDFCESLLDHLYHLQKGQSSVTTCSCSGRPESKSQSALGFEGSTLLVPIAENGPGPDRLYQICKGPGLQG